MPHGLRVEGNDKTRVARSVFDFDLQGKAVLDVGTYYGFFPLYAIQHGARKAVGLEVDPERFSIARGIAHLHGEPYAILQGSIEEAEFDERFDVVLFLNVLHHLRDPIPVMRKLAAVCKDKVIVEFCTPSDSAYIRYTYQTGAGTIVSRANRVRAVLRSWVVRIAIYRLPMIAIGNWEYHRTFYFSPEAFYNLFVIHHKLFNDVTFRRGLTNDKRTIAVCTVRDRR